MEEIKRIVTEISVESQDKAFEPWSKVEKKLSAMPNSIYADPLYQSLVFKAGYGQYPAAYIERMMDAMKDVLLDENIRYKFIIENRIYMFEESIDKARELVRIFNPDGDLDLKLFVGDILKTPKIFFQLPEREREIIFPWHTVRGYDQVPADEITEAVLVCYPEENLLIDLEKDVVDWSIYRLSSNERPSGRKRMMDFMGPGHIIDMF